MNNQVSYSIQNIITGKLYGDIIYGYSMTIYKDVNFEKIINKLKNSTIIIYIKSSMSKQDEYQLKIEDYEIRIPGFICDYEFQCDKILCLIPIKNFILGTLNSTPYKFNIILNEILNENVNVKEINYLYQPLVKTNTINQQVDFIQNTIQKKINDYSNDNKYLNVQKKVEGKELCRGVWIKMNISDYYSIEKIKILINFHDAIIYEKNELENVKKICYDDIVVLYINLEKNDNLYYLTNNLSDNISIYNNLLSNLKKRYIKPISDIFYSEDNNYCVLIQHDKYLINDNNTFENMNNDYSIYFLLLDYIPFEI